MKPKGEQRTSTNPHPPARPKTGKIVAENRYFQGLFNKEHFQRFNKNSTKRRFWFWLETVENFSGKIQSVFLLKTAKFCL